MQVKSIAECSKGAFCNTFDLHLATVSLEIFVLSIFEWPLKTSFTVYTIQIQELTLFSVMRNPVRAS